MIRFVIALMTLATLVAGDSRTAFAQQSPASTASARIGGKTLTVQYSAPSVRGRQIFGSGNLVSKDPTYPIWRAGANAATTLRVDADVTIGTLRVPRGSYTLYVNVRDMNAWELVVSKQTGQWGLDYDPKQDLGRVRMTMSKPPTLVETLRYEIHDGGAGKGELRLSWEQHTATVPITAAP